MRKWIRIILRLAIIFTFLSITIYIFMPSMLVVKASTLFKCTPRVAYQRLINPSYWISRSEYLVAQNVSFTVKATKPFARYSLFWGNEKKEKCILESKENVKFELITYGFAYQKETEGELQVNLISHPEGTIVNITLDIDLPDSFWTKIKAYYYYLFMKRDIKRGLNSIALDCALNEKLHTVLIQEGKISDFRAYIKKINIRGVTLSKLSHEVRVMQAQIPADQQNGLPYAQFTSNPFDDTTEIVVGIPTTIGTLQRVPNSILSLYSQTTTLYTTTKIKNGNIEDIYGQLLYHAKLDSWEVNGYPIVFFNESRGRATMHLPVEK